MTRIDRAGRKKSIRKVLMQQAKRKDDRWMTVGMIARRLGLKSSTYIKNLAFEIAMENDWFMWREDRGKREYAYQQPIQRELPKRYITINGKERLVAMWAMSDVEVFGHE